MEKILIATNNYGKVKEIKEILDKYELLTLKDLNVNIEVEEDGKTFEENSLKKAKVIYEKTKIPCIADDSGLCIDKLDNWPGVYTARFIGDETTRRKRNLEIIEKMKNLQGEERKARFVCVVTYYNNGKIVVGKGEIIGKISENPRGDNGFGFDEIFELDNGKTLAELTLEEKNKISHRGNALAQIKDELDKIKDL